MDWTIKPFNQANHNPVVSVNGQVGVAPITIETTVGQPVTLYASANKDLDGNELNYQWFHYEEAGVVTRANFLPARYSDCPFRAQQLAITEFE